jgi:hypothetical protein
MGKRCPELGGAALHDADVGQCGNKLRNRYVLRERPGNKAESITVVPSLLVPQALL